MLVLLMIYFFFFFSSRRRHTRFDCDWSSDVCSSDLTNLYISINNYCPDIFCEIYDMILDYPRFISGIEVFSFECYYWPLLITSPTRSEERRVGKECRYGWLWYFLK